MDICYEALQFNIEGPVENFESDFVRIEIGEDGINFRCRRQGELFFTEYRIENSEVIIHWKGS